MNDIDREALLWQQYWEGYWDEKNEYKIYRKFIREMSFWEKVKELFL